MRGKKYSITVVLCLVLCSGSLIAFDSHPGDGYHMVPLISFSEEESRRNWSANPWGGGECKAEVLDYESDEKFTSFLRTSFNNALMTLSNNTLFQGVRRKWLDGTADGFYLWARLTGEQDVSIRLEYRTISEGETYLYSRELNIEPGRWQLVEVPLGGWQRHEHEFNINELYNIGLIISGTGNLDLGIVGMKQRYNIIKPGIARGRGIPYISSSVEIDGMIGRAERAEAAEIKLEELPCGGGFSCRGGCMKEEMEVFAGWNKDGIYLSAKMFRADGFCRDERMGFYFLSPEETEVLDILRYTIDDSGEAEFSQLQTNVKGYKAAAEKFADRWEAEFFLPWNELNMDPGKSPLLGFNVFGCCCAAGNDIEELTGLAGPKGGEFSDFGVLLLRPDQKKYFCPGRQNVNFARIDKGNYLILGESLTRGAYTYRLWVYSSNLKEVYFQEGNLSPGRFSIPFSLEIEKTDNYFLNFIMLDEAGDLANYFEAQFAEEAESDWERLPADAFALFPEPKELKISGGRRELSRDTSFYVTSDDIAFCGERIRDEIYGFYGVMLKEAGRIGEADIVIDYGLSNPEVEGYLGGAGLGGAYGRIKHDGYIALITPERIVVTAREKRGALYGTNVLLDIIKMTTGDIGPPVYAKNLHVVDWPDFKNRIWTDRFSCWRPARKVPCELYKSMVEKFPLRFRYNGLGVAPSDYYHWEAAPDVRLSQGWKPGEFRRLIQFVNRRYVPVIPFFYGAHGHAQWLLDHQAYYHLREGGDRRTFCTQHPGFYPLIFSFMDELIEITSDTPEFKSDYFFVGLDEVRWKNGSSPANKRCHFCTDIPKHEIYLEHIKNISDFLRERKYRMIMAVDMLVEEHRDFSGDWSFDCAYVRERLPKDIIAVHWSSIHYPAIPRFLKLKLENWKRTTGYRVDRMNEHMVTGRGFSIWTYNWWLSLTRAPTQANYGLLAQALYANAAWNIFPDVRNTTWRKYERIYGNYLIRNWSRKPIPGATDEMRAIDISGAVNAPVTDSDGSGWFGTGSDNDLSLMDFSVEEIEGIPVAFAEKDGEINAVILKGGEVSREIKVGGRAGSIILLHAAHIDEGDLGDFRHRSNYRDRPEGPPIAKYRVRYADGETEEFTVNIGWHISPWQTDPMSRTSVFSKYVTDARSILEGHTRSAKKKNLLPDIAIYQYEWVNPYPGREIKSLTVEGVGHDASRFVSYALLSLSARGVR